MVILQKYLPYLTSYISYIFYDFLWSDPDPDNLIGSRSGQKVGSATLSPVVTVRMRFSTIFDGLRVKNNTRNPPNGLGGPLRIIDGKEGNSYLRLRLRNNAKN